MPEFVDQERTDGSEVTVVADHVFQLDGAIKMLWENKSLKVFDAFVGRQLINEIKARRSGTLTQAVASYIRRLPSYNGQGLCGCLCQ